MKSTLKRELKAREAVERETRSASNVPRWFSRLGGGGRAFRIRRTEGAVVRCRAAVHSIGVRVSVGLPADDKARWKVARGSPRVL